MARKAGERYTCEKCGAVIAYEKPCPCTEGQHSEICCGQQMKAIT